MRFASTLWRSMRPRAATRIVVEMVADRAKAVIDASLPKEISLTDPQATWVARAGVDPFFAYDANYLIDNKVGIILDAVGTRANRAVEIAVTQTMVDRVERRFDLRPGDWRVTRLMAQYDCSNGWLIATSRRTYRCGTNRHARMALSADPTSSSIRSTISISARAVRN